jgi:hypothetical protein
MLRLLSSLACPRRALQFGHLQPLTRSWTGWWMLLTREVRATLRAEFDAAIDEAMLYGTGWPAYPKGIV